MKRFETHMIVLACLLAFVGFATVCQPTSTSSSLPPSPPLSGGGGDPGSPERREGERFLLLDYLPPGYVTDASIDYSTEVRTALFEAAGGTLELPSFPVLVSRALGQSWCLLVTSPITITGDVGSALVANESGVQLLRAEDVDGLTLRGFTIAGSGLGGQGLEHGLLQVTGGKRVIVDGLHITDADADGIAIADAEDVLVTGCIIEAASKAGLYVNASSRVVVRGNTISRFGGHLTSSGNLVGVAIQLSSNSDVVCTSNVIEEGTGIGILCNANAGGAPPAGTVISDNRIVRVTNPGGLDSSAGIRLTNGALETFTQTVVRGNSIRDCGAYGIFVENHGGALITGNSIVECEQVGIIVGTVRDAIVTGNVIFNSGTSGLAGLYQILLINDASGVVVRDNILRDTGSVPQASAYDTVMDSSQSGDNVVFGRESRADAPPLVGRWLAGDVVFHAHPTPSGPLGWICVSNGSPGIWRPFGN